MHSGHGIILGFELLTIRTISSSSNSHLLRISYMRARISDVRENVSGKDQWVEEVEVEVEE